MTAVLAFPFAAAWGVGHARVDDYLGPQQVTFATNYSGEVKIDLGPLGNGYLPSPASPVGVTATVGGVGVSGAAGATSINSLFSPQNLAAYENLYEEPKLAVSAIVDRLVTDAWVEAAKAELLLVVAALAWRTRGHVLHPPLARTLSRRRTVALYVSVLTVVAGSALCPQSDRGPRIPVGAALGPRFSTVSVDNPVLAELVDRGVQGVALLSARQQQGVSAYIDEAVASLSSQTGRFPAPHAGETMLLGFSDLHCNEAMTELIGRVERATQPRVVISSGDDTTNGIAVEKACVQREARIASGVPLVVSSGNHDSNVTEAQQRDAGMVVLDGRTVTAARLTFLGDDDPEHNIPFSVDRVRDRAETEEQMAARLLRVAYPAPVDVLTVHQPAAAAPLLTAADVPARLVVWGHMHAQVGPTVVYRDDGSWTVGMQEGTAGGVKQPTITSFSTPFSPPLVSADIYFYFRDDATGLITGVQPMHFLPDGHVRIATRVRTGNLNALPALTRVKLTGASSPQAARPVSDPSSVPLSAAHAQTSRHAVVPRVRSAGARTGLRSWNLSAVGTAAEDLR